MGVTVQLTRGTKDLNLGLHVWQVLHQPSHLPTLFLVFTPLTNFTEVEARGSSRVSGQSGQKSETSKQAKRSIEMHTRNPSTQLGGRGRKIRSPRLPSVTPSLRSAYACKHAYSGTLACTQRNRHRHNRCTYMHSFYASQEILEKKNIYESTHNLTPKKTTEKTTVHFLPVFSWAEAVYEKAGDTSSFFSSSEK